MRRLIVTSLLTGLIVFGFSVEVSAAGFHNAGGMNGSSFQGNGFNGSGLQGNGYNGGYLQGSSYNAGGFQGTSLNGPGFQGNGLNASAVPGDASGRHVSPTADTSDDVRIRVSVPRHGLRLNGVILADPAASSD